MFLRHLLLVLSAFLAFGLTARGGVDNTDVTISTQAARAWWLRGDPALLDAETAAETGIEAWGAETAIVGYIRGGRYGMQGTEGRHYVWFPIGHQALLVGCVAAARGFADQLPQPEAPERLVPYEGDHAQEAFWTAFLASFLPVLGASLAFAALASLGVTLGLSRKQALLTAVLATFCTQFWPGTNETMSNMPGAGLSVPSVAFLVAWLHGRGGTKHLVAGALLSGFAVLVRYPAALFLSPFWIAVVWRCLRDGDFRALGWFAAAGAPAAILLALANWMRFGTLGETGYSPGAGMGGYPTELGLASILIAPGKGILWFSPLLVWLGVRFAKARQLPSWMPTLGLLLPIALFSNVVYWAAGQCWGIRYLSAPIAVFVTWAFAKLRPFDRPRSLAAIAGLGLLISLGGVLVSYVNYRALTAPVAAEWYPEATNPDLNADWDPRLSPLHGHWRLLLAEQLGHLDRKDAAPLARSMFDADLGAAEDPPRRLALPWTTTDLRHLWWRRLELVFPRFDGTQVALLWAGATLLLGAIAAFAWMRRSPEAEPAD